MSKQLAAAVRARVDADDDAGAWELLRDVRPALLRRVAGHLDIPYLDSIHTHAELVEYVRTALAVMTPAEQARTRETIEARHAAIATWGEEEA